MTGHARPLETGWAAGYPIGTPCCAGSRPTRRTCRITSCAVGGRSDRTPGVAVSESGVAAAYLNQAVLLRPIADAHDPVPDQVAAFYAGSAAAHPGTRRSSETAGRCARHRPASPAAIAHRLGGAGAAGTPGPTHARKETHRCATTRWSPPW
jgi:hypothetical protein